jgi:glycine oxidase
MKPHVVVIGAGIIGAATARELARRGHPVTLLERGAEAGRRASWAAAGILTPIHLADYPEPLAQMCREAAAMYADWASEVERETGVAVEYRVTGALFVGEGACALEHEVLEGPALRKREPLLSPAIPRAAFAPAVAQVRNQRLVRALVASATRHGAGVRTRCGAVLEAARSGDRAVSVRTEAGTFLADAVVIAAGAWSGEVGKVFGLEIPVRPVRGQIVLLETEPGALRHIVLDAGGRYLVPRADGKVLAGTTMEEAGFDDRATVEGVEGILRWARETVPASAQWRVAAAWAGLRPALPERTPLVGPAPGWANVFVAAGHFRNGILLAPHTARKIADWLARTQVS